MKKQKGYIIKSEEGENVVKKSIFKKAGDYIRYHYASILGYSASVFFFADSAYKAYLGDMDAAKDEFYLAFAAAGISTGYKYAFEIPIKMKIRSGEMEKDFNVNDIRNAVDYLKEMVSPLTTPLGKESESLDFLYDQFKVNKALKEEFNINPGIDLDDMNDITDIGERIISENRKLLEMLPD